MFHSGRLQLAGENIRLTLKRDQHSSLLLDREKFYEIYIQVCYLSVVLYRELRVQVILINEMYGIAKTIPINNLHL